MARQHCDPFIFTRKTPFMQRIADLVRTGHSRYVTGQISIEKVAFFSAKMELLYDCFASRLIQCRSRKAGYATARLLFWHDHGTASVQWILLATEGRWQTPDSGEEKWADPTATRILLTGYELVRHIRTGNSKPSWTWRYQVGREQDIRAAILQAIRARRDEELRRLVIVIWKSPGFAGIREQVKKFGRLIHAEWARSRVGDPPELPQNIGWVRRLADKGKRSSVLKKELLNAVV